MNYITFCAYNKVFDNVPELNVVESIVTDFSKDVANIVFLFIVKMCCALFAEVITHGAYALAKALNAKYDEYTGHDVHLDASFLIVQPPHEDSQKAKSTQTVPTGFLPGGQVATQELLKEFP